MSRATKLVLVEAVVDGDGMYRVRCAPVNDTHLAQHAWLPSDAEHVHPHPGVDVEDLLRELAALWEYSSLRAVHGDAEKHDAPLSRAFRLRNARLRSAEQAPKYHEGETVWVPGQVAEVQPYMDALPNGPVRINIGTDDHVTVLCRRGDIRREPPEET